ncbi:hypothetical protein D623_10028011 [Myotis brandtii]|uniref:Uncharacterized protein n=1 Tax=Myotis brandtii TaxID=109478 RepID=S7PM24_MYOBR|nr:hypothetical protein D623_10028011 [Myotis brandtii]
MRKRSQRPMEAAMLDAGLRSRGLHPRYSRALEAAVSADRIGTFPPRGCQESSANKPRPAASFRASEVLFPYVYEELASGRQSPIWFPQTDSH